MNPLSELWETRLVANVACDVFTPPAVKATIVFLHGMDGNTLVDNELWSQEALKASVSIIAPHGEGEVCADQPLDHTTAPYCWWLDAGEMPIAKSSSTTQIPISPESWLIDQLQPDLQESGLPYLLAGYEVGGQGALRVAYRHARKFPIVAAVAPKVDLHNIFGLGTSLDRLFPTSEAVRQQEATVWLNPLLRPNHQFILCDPAHDFCYPGCQTLLTKLSSTGCPHEVSLETTPGLQWNSGTLWNCELNAAAKRIFAFLGRFT